MNPLVADLLKQIQSTSSQNRPPQGVVIGGQAGGPVVTQSNSVLLGGISCTPVTSRTASHCHVHTDNYTYKVKIINPAKKSEVIVRHLNNFTAKFDTVMALRLKLVEAFTDTVDFSVGYYEGSQQSKVWLVTADDLKKMYEGIKSGHITLWCDRKTESEHAGRKRKRESESTLRKEKEEEVERVYTELVGKHGKGEYSVPLLRLWARVIVTGHHDDYDEPPDWPQFKTQATATPKRKQGQDSLSDALTGAAKVFAEAVASNRHASPSSGPHCSQSQTSTSACISPAKKVDLRMKNYEQLRFLQQLYDDGILCEKEYTEQKESIIGFLRTL